MEGGVTLRRMGGASLVNSGLLENRIVRTVPLVIARQVFGSFVVFIKSINHGEVTNRTISRRKGIRGHICGLETLHSLLKSTYAAQKPSWEINFPYNCIIANTFLIATNRPRRYLWTARVL